MNKIIKIGYNYQHYKNKKYYIPLLLAKNEKNGQEKVIYQELISKKIFERPYDEFIERFSEKEFSRESILKFINDFDQML